MYLIVNKFQIKSLSENTYSEIYKETTIVIFPISGIGYDV